MERIFCYVGSNSENSIGCKIAKEIKHKLKNNEIKTYFYEGRRVNIKCCRGCSQCFSAGQCTLDSEDDMERIKKDMKLSDIIIWISPVYAVNVSGMMKNYIDRLSSWMHTLELAGKKGIVVAISSNTGMEFTVYYMKTILQAMGCHVLKDYKINCRKGWQFEEIIEDIRRKIEIGLKKKGQYTKDQEQTYSNVKQAFFGIPEDKRSSNAYEIEYWHRLEERGIDSYDKYVKWKEKNNGIQVL